METDNMLEIPLDDAVKSSNYGVPCGGCQWMGEDPPMESGTCGLCGRTREKIIADHGKVELSKAEIEQRRDAAFAHMTGVNVVYR